MEITLVRHGQSLINPPSQMTYKEFLFWQKEYDRLSIKLPKRIPHNTMNQVVNADLVITSDLPRAVDSARNLNPSCKVIQNKLYQEVDIPLNPQMDSQYKNSFVTWNLIIRSLWLGGYNNNGESVMGTLHRVDKATEHLINYTNNCSHILVVGHVFFNLLIGNALESRGWKKMKNQTGQYWDYSNYLL